MELIAAILTGFILLAVLGIIIAFSPTLIITQIGILTRSRAAARNNTAFILGITSAIVLLLLIALLGIDPAYKLQLPSTRVFIRTIPLVDIIIGMLLVFNGYRLRDAKPPRPTAPKHYGVGAKSLYSFGLIKMASSLSSITAILIAARYIKTVSQGPAMLLLTSMWLIIVAVAPFVLLGALQRYKPHLFAKIQRTSDRTAALNWRRLISVALIFLGCYFLVIGITNW